MSKSAKDKADYEAYMEWKANRPTHVVIEASVEGETEKALKVSASVDTASGQRGRSLWLPKSQSEVLSDSTISIPRWLYDSKESEIAQGSCYGLVVIEG